MTSLLPLAPRYRLDDELPWLEGIDPSRHYWIWINGVQENSIALPGLNAASLEEFKLTLRQFRALQPGQQMTLARAAQQMTIHCVSSNCFGVEVQHAAAPVWHLFDQETLDSLLMTAHPDWQCAPQHLELGYRMLSKAWAQPIAA